MKNNKTLYNEKLVIYPNGDKKMILYPHYISKGYKRDEAYPRRNNKKVYDISMAKYRARINKNNAVRRATNKIYDIMRSNQDTFKYFVTLTFDRKKINRYNYNEVSKALTRYFELLHKRDSENFKYIAVFEKHKDGAFHVHALFSDCNLKLKKLNKLRFGNPSYELTDFKYGRTFLYEIKNIEKATYYITKYIIKTMDEFDLKNKKVFRASQNLKSPVVQYIKNTPAEQNKKFYNSLECCSGHKKKLAYLGLYWDDMHIFQFVSNRSQYYEIPKNYKGLLPYFEYREYVENDTAYLSMCIEEYEDKYVMDYIQSDEYKETINEFYYETENNN